MGYLGLGFKGIVPLKWIEYGFGHIIMSSPYAPFSIDLRGTIVSVPQIPMTQSLNPKPRNLLRSEGSLLEQEAKAKAPLDFGAWGLGFRVWGLAFRVWDLGCRGVHIGTMG